MIDQIFGGIFSLFKLIFKGIYFILSWVFKLLYNAFSELISHYKTKNHYNKLYDKITPPKFDEWV